MHHTEEKKNQAVGQILMEKCEKETIYSLQREKQCRVLTAMKIHDARRKALETAERSDLSVCEFKPQDQTRQS